MAQKSRILLLTTSYLPSIGGSELAIFEITKRLPQIEFDLITSRSDSSGRFDPSRLTEEVQNNVHIYRVGNRLTLSRFLLPKNWLPISIALKTFSLNKKNHYQIIHAYQASQAAGAGWLVKVFYPKIKFILTIQEGKELKKQSWLTRRFRAILIGAADQITVISKYLRDYAISLNPRVPVSLIPNGVDLKKFVPSMNKTTSEGPIIITTSRLVEKNGLKDLVNAFSIVKKDISNAKLVIIGKGQLEDVLKSRIEELNLSQSVHLVGEVPHDELPKYLASADIFVRPSLSEGLGTSFLEAMACGLAVIGTPVGGIPDFLVDGETGLMCKPGDANDIAAKISRLIKDIFLRSQIVKKSQAMVHEFYHWDNIASKFALIYHGQ